MVTPKDIRNFVEGNVIYAIQDYVPEYIQEQIALRKFLCGDCLQLGKCPHCGCKTPEMFSAPKKIDKQLKWAEFLNESQWIALKNNIDRYKEFFDAANK